MTDDQIQIPFSGAVDESTDPRHLPPGVLAASLNGVFDQDGQLQVRYGYTMLNTSGLSSVFRLAVFAFELVCISLAGACASYSPTDAAFVVRDTSTPIGVTHAPLTNSTTTYTSWSIVDVNGYRIVAWIDASDNFPRAAVYDQTTGALVLSKVISSTSSVNLYLGAVGNTVILTMADNGSANIRASTLNTSPLGTWSVTGVISDLNYSSTTGVYVAAFGSNLFTIAYEQTAAGNSKLRVLGFDATVGLQYTVGNSLTAGTHGFQGLGARLTVGEQYWVTIYAATTGYANRVIAVEMNPATGVLATSFSVGFDTGGPGAMQMGLERLSATQQLATVTDGLNTWTLQLTTAGVVAASTVEIFNVRTLGAPTFVSSLSTTVQLWSDDSLGAAGGPPGGSYYLMDLLTGTPGTFPQLVTVLAPNIASLALQPGVSLQFPSTPWAVNASGKLETVAPILDTAAGRQGIELFTADPTANYRYSVAQLGKELYIGGYRYDSQVLVEDGFAQQPTLSLANNTGSGSTFQYAVTYGWIDAHGNLEESPPTPIASVTSGATPNVQVTVRTTGISRKQRTPANVTSGKIAIILYRTQAIASGDSTLYRVTTEPFTHLNDPTAQSIVFSDTLSDASLTDGTHPVLYTVSGELTHDTPETFTSTTVHKNRVWGIGADQRTIWWSSQYVDPVVPFFNDTQQMTVDDAGEPLTCLASLYDKLLIFTRSKIYVVYGDGPSPAGTGNDLSNPQRVPSPAGCIDPRSIVSTPMGVFFQSQRGLELIDPALNVSFIGQPISTTTKTFPVCTSACLVEVNSVVRFSFASSDVAGPGQLGRVVNFDLRRSRWTVHALNAGGSKGSVPAPVQTAVVHPTLGYVEGHNDNPLAAIVSRENTTADATPWLDYGSAFVPLSWTTGWVKAADLQGWTSVRKIRVLGNYYDNHALSFTLNFDYQATNEIHAYSDVTLFSTFGASYEQLMLQPGPARRCQAVQVSGTTLAPSTEAVNSGRGAGFIGLAFEVHVQKGGFRHIPIAARS